MELKSPLTIRQNSTVPFQQDTGMPIQQRDQYIDNPYNNRGILKSNNPYSMQQQQQQEQQQQQFEANYNGNTMTMQSIGAPAPRNIFLNRSYYEAPRNNGFTNGYDTDSGLINNNNNNNNNHSYRHTSTGGIQSYNNSLSRNSHGSAYKTLGPQFGSTTQTTSIAPNRYQLLNDHSGYDTDTGLIKLKQVLDNRRASSRNGMQTPQHFVQQPPTPNGYYYQQNRSMTPSLSQYSNGYNNNTT
jgi:hypothetical protein